MQLSIKQLLGLVALVAFVLFTYLITRKPEPKPPTPPPNTGITLISRSQGDQKSFIVILDHKRMKNSSPRDKFVIRYSTTEVTQSPQYLQYLSSESPKKYVYSIWHDKLGYIDNFAKAEPAAYAENIQTRYEQLDQAFVKATGFSFRELAGCLFFEQQNHPRYQQFLAKKWSLDDHNSFILRLDLDQSVIEPHIDFVNKQNALHLLTR